MKVSERLYLRIYFAMLAALVVAAVIITFAWRHSFEGGFLRTQFASLAAEIAGELLPSEQSSLEQTRRTLERWRHRGQVSLALYGRNRALIAAAGETVPRLPAEQESSGWLHGQRGPPAMALRLDDGRWLVARHDRPGRSRPMGFLFSMVLIALVLGIMAYPLARRLTKRLENLQTSVESLGAGNLAVRVPVQGHDEVAALARSFNQAAGQIESLVQSQKSLLANASHELRSPLVRLRMTAEAFSVQADPALRDNIRQDIRELDRLIDEILLASRLDSNTGHLSDFEDVDLTALVAEECARAGVPLDAVATNIRGDPTLLRRLVRNLLDNALRYAGQAGTDAQVTRSEKATRISIRDRGAGIPDSERSRIFQPFYRIPGASDRTHGAGLGLALVKQIAELHGGSVLCISRPDGGTAFEVSFPPNPHP